MAQIVNVRVSELRPEYESLIDWLQDPDHIYIGRDMSFYVDGAYPSKWHNPYKIARPGRKNATCKSLDESLMLYEQHVRDNLIDDIEELRGKTLGCWCKPDRCHGDVLVKILNEQSQEKTAKTVKTVKTAKTR